mmetsp:Transcript_81862/g.232042  ORF Transcript_81862/g.232042 Transcript_81862/m.232042 type:complete len:222 (+) Transcript_81862:1161-1826(+)
MQSCRNRVDVALELLLSRAAKRSVSGKACTPLFCAVRAFGSSCPLAPTPPRSAPSSISAVEAAAGKAAAFAAADPCSSTNWSDLDFTTSAAAAGRLSSTSVPKAPSSPVASRRAWRPSVVLITHVRTRSTVTGWSAGSKPSASQNSGSARRSTASTTAVAFSRTISLTVRRPMSAVIVGSSTSIARFLSTSAVNMMGTLPFVSVCDTQLSFVWFLMHMSEK